METSSTAIVSRSSDKSKFDTIDKIHLSKFCPLVTWWLPIFVKRELFAGASLEIGRWKHFSLNTDFYANYCQESNRDESLPSGPRPRLTLIKIRQDQETRFNSQLVRSHRFTLLPQSFERDFEGEKMKKYNILLLKGNIYCLNLATAITMIWLGSKGTSFMV